MNVYTNNNKAHVTNEITEISKPGLQVELIADVQGRHHCKLLPASAKGASACNPCSDPLALSVLTHIVISCHATTIDQGEEMQSHHHQVEKKIMTLQCTHR